MFVPWVWLGLLQVSCDDGGIHCTAVVEEYTYYLLNDLFFCFGYSQLCVNCLCILYCHAICGCGVEIWLHLWLVWLFVTKLDEGIFNVSWHGEVHLVLRIVPIKCDS